MKDEKQKQYFSQAGLQYLKKDIDLVFAIGAEIKLVKMGKRFFGQCPLHNDKGNSLVISPKKNLWYCFGSCKRGGSIVDWLMSSKKLSVVEALAYLAESYPFLAQKGQVGNLGLNETVPEQADLLKHQPILLQIVEHYHSCLLDQSRAIRYLRSLGINHTAVKKHKIGFCDSSLARAFLDRVNMGDDILKRELQELGLLKMIAEAGIKERFDRQIVFPVFDQQGQCVQLFGRKMPAKIRESHIQLMVS